MELTLTKSKDYKLEPYGKFNIKWVKHPEKCAINTIPFIELEIYHDSSYPMTAEQEQEIVNFMKANKTDILTDGSYLGFYTRLNEGLVMVRHPKLLKYREDEVFRSMIDGE